MTDPDQEILGRIRHRLDGKFVLTEDGAAATATDKQRKPGRKQQLGIHGLYHKDPLLADKLVFGRTSCKANRRGWRRPNNCRSPDIYGKVGEKRALVLLIRTEACASLDK